MDDAAPIREHADSSNDASHTTDDDRFDCMNLRPARTGVDGAIFISTREPSYGPRVKVYAGRPGVAKPSVVLSIERDPRRLEPASPNRALLAIEPSAKEWVRLKRVRLLEFWNEGVDGFKDEVDAFEASLMPLPR